MMVLQKTEPTFEKRFQSSETVIVVKELTQVLI